MKDQLIFNTSSAATIADSDSVGAYVRASDGTLIDKETINSVERLAVDATLKDGAGNAISSTGGALDVNLKSPVVVDVDLDGIYNAGTNPTPDSVGLIGHVRGASPALADQTFAWTGGVASSDAVVAANVHAMDVNSFLMGYNGTTWDRLKSTSGALDVNIASGTVTVNDAALANTAVTSKTNTLDAANTAELAVAAALASRKYLWVYNAANQKVYIGGATVTAANGFPISPGSYMELRAGASAPVYFVGASGTTPEIRTLELS